MHTTEFRNRRFQNWIFLGLMYGFFYASRYNLSSIQTVFMSRFGFMNSDYSYIIAVGSLVYGIAVFLNGPLADRIGGKKAILIGAAGAAIFNLLFGLCNLLVTKEAVWVGVEQSREIATQASFAFGLRHSTIIATLAVIWAGNNYFQSFGALSIVKINAAWFHIKERGKFAGIFGLMIQSGRLFAKKLGPVILAYSLPLQWAFWIPAFFLCLMWVVGKLKIENSPEEAGIGEFDTGEDLALGGPKVSLKEVIFRVLTRPIPWVIALSSMCLGVVRSSMENWDQKLISSVFKVAPTLLNSYGPNKLVIYGAPIASVLGGLAAGNASDRLFGSRRGPVIFFAFIMQAVSLLLMYNYLDSPWISCFAIVLSSFFIQGVQSMIGGAASMDFGGKRAAATAAGFFDGAQYLAAGFVALWFGKKLDFYRHHKVFWGHPINSEFEVWPLMLLPFCLLGALLISTLWNKRAGKSGH